MAVFNVTNGLCTGRGFVSGAYLQEFADWVVQSPPNGPGWHILMDRTSSSITDPQTCSYDDATSDYRFDKSSHPFYTGERVLSSAVTSGYGYIRKLNDDSFSLYISPGQAFIGGSGGRRNFFGSGTTDVTLVGPYIVASDQSSLQPNSPDATNAAPKIVKIGMYDAEAGFIRVQFPLALVEVSSPFEDKVMPQIVSGYLINTLDDAEFEYDFRGGDEAMMIAASTGATYDLAGIDQWIGDNVLVRGKDKYGILTSDATTGTGVILTLQDSSQAADFEIGFWYYLYDFTYHTDSTEVYYHNRANYVEITGTGTGSGLSADQIKVGELFVDFPTGAVIAAYRHRLYTFGNYTLDYEYVTGEPGMCWTEQIRLPYISSKSGSLSVVHNMISPTMLGGSQFDVAKGYLQGMNLDDLGRQAAQHPGIAEYDALDGGSDVMNRAYGNAVNTYIAENNYDSTAYSPGRDGLNINSREWVYMSSAIPTPLSQDGFFLLNTESDT